MKKCKTIYRNKAIFSYASHTTPIYSNGYFPRLSQITNIIMPPPLIGRGIKRCFCLRSVWRLSHTSRLSREQRPTKTKFSTEVAHVTRDSDTTFRVKRSKVKVTRALWLAVQVTTWCTSTRTVSTPPPRASRCLSIMNIHGARRTGRWRGIRRVGLDWRWAAACVQRAVQGISCRRVEIIEGRMRSKPTTGRRRIQMPRDWAKDDGYVALKWTGKDGDTENGCKKNLLYSRRLLNEYRRSCCLFTFLYKNLWG